MAGPWIQTFAAGPLRQLRAVFRPARRRRFSASKAAVGAWVRLKRATVGSLRLLKLHAGVGGLQARKYLLWENRPSGFTFIFVNIRFPMRIWNFSIFKAAS